MAIELAPLPYDKKALEPQISARTMDLHYEKHHGGYVKKVNKAIEGTNMASWPLDKLISETRGNSSQLKVYQNAAQVWNHSFFWQSLSPRGGGAAPPDVARLLSASFGSVEAFKEKFLETSKGLFGSGWVWLVKAGDRLEVIDTKDADNPVGTDRVALATVDLWEHAYYLDYQNKKGDFVKTILDGLWNWRFVQENLAKA